MIDNKYLMDKASRRRMGGDRHERYPRYNAYLEREQQGMRQDEARGRDRNYDERFKGYNYDMRDMGDLRSDYRGDYARGRSDYYSMPMDHSYDMRNDYAMDYASGEKEYRHKLEKVKHKLEPKNRFRLDKNEVSKHAKIMGAKLNDYDEEDLFVAYLMMVSDYKSAGNEPKVYIAMAKEFLEDDDTAYSGQAKLCAYIDAIVFGDM